MDIHSIEFYVLAFMVAVALVALLLGQRKQMPAVTRIVELPLGEPGDMVPINDAAPVKPSTLRLTARSGGMVTIERTAIPLHDGETVNLIATIIDDKITIQEKKGMVAAFGSREQYYDGSVDVDFFPFEKVYVRYESQVNGQWSKFSFLNREGNTVAHDLTY